jgi:hypothetical protein
VGRSRSAGAVRRVETLEQLWDAAEVLVRFGAPPRAGAAILCDGGVRGVLADQSEAVGLPLAKLDSANPTDLSRTGLTDWEQYGRLARTLLNNDAVGSLIISIMPGPPEVGLRNARATLPALKGSGKPVVYTLMGGTSPTAPDLTPEMQAAGVPFRRSPERVVRSMAKLTRFGMRQAAQDGADFHVRIGEAPAPQQTSVSHWSGTQRGSGAPPNKKVVHAALSASPLASDGALLTWTGAPLTDLGGDLEKAGAIVCNFLGVDPTAEDEFNAWYDTEHLPRLCAVPGVLGARRYNSSSHTPRYIALYLLAHAGVADSPAWREAAGTPWTARMRGYTRGFLSFILTRAVV